MVLGTFINTTMNFYSMSKSEVVNATFYRETVLTEDSDAARELYNKSRFGTLVSGKVELNLIETLYLLEKKRLELLKGKNKKITEEEFILKAKRLQKNFWVKYVVFRDLRTRGYIVKTALKFGADFRVYDRGIKPGEDHAKWLVFSFY